jgi:putative inorganic carbon (HCO3(-)) transporter
MTQAAPHRPMGMLTFFVAGYVALLPYLFQIERKLNFAPSDLFLFLALLLVAGRLKYCKPAWTGWHFAIPVLFAFGSMVAAVRFGGLDRYELLNKDFGLLLPFLSYIAITSVVREWKDVRFILRIFVLSVVIENIVALAGFMAAYFFGIATPFTQYEGLRLSGMLLDPNAYGGLLVVALMVCESASQGPAPLLGKRLLWISRVSLSLGILFTFSRSAWLALGLSLLLLCLLQMMVAVRLVLATAIAAPFLFLVMGLRFAAVFERVARRPEQVRERFDLLDAGARMFAQHPFIGGGLGSFRLSTGMVAHNSLMWFLADFGIVGLFVILGFLVWFFNKAWLAYRFAPRQERPLALALMLAHVAMLGLAMGIEAFYQRHWWLVLALIASSYSLVRRNLNQTGVSTYVHP